MGIYGALSTAVTGLRAQAFALENISGNIANSQTTGFKRIDTDFLDLIPDAPQARQTAGSVIAQSRSTNNMQGDVKTAGTETYMAINGTGFFVVEPAIGQSDGDSIFSGANYYTRRGDFEINKNGYLVSGSGYYLKGLSIDSTTQNISGSVPQVLRVSTAFLPAQQTTRINYQLNLPQLPNTNAFKDSQTAGSELLDGTDFVAVVPDTAATATGATLTGGALASTIAAVGETIQIQVGATSRTYTFTNAGGTAGLNIDLTVSTTVAAVLAAMQTDFQAQVGQATTTIGLSGGVARITAGNLTNSVTVVDNTTGSSANGLGFANATSAPTISAALRLATRVPTITAAQSDLFNQQSITGGAITVFSSNGAPVNVQMRWAKVNSTVNGGAEVWNLFIATNAQATGAQTMWTRMGGDYTFGNNGAPNPPIDHTDLTALTVNGVLIGDVRLEFGDSGLTQFADPNGQAEVALNQNGYAAGEYVSVAINDSGRVVVSYDNGKQLEVAQVVTANFNAVNQLKRMDGGVFAATSDSGEPVLDNGGSGISGSSLEASNTDISEEFTKLIVTQQAYAAGTRIVSTADQMLQEALNMIR